MKVLVTGGAGFVGTNLIIRLLKEGHEVISIDNYYTGNEDNHIEGAEYVNADIRSFNFESLPGIDIIYHMAALARIQPSFKNPLECFEVNATGTIKLAKYASDNKIPIVYAGTSSKHSGKYKNPYTFTKDIGEDIITLCLPLWVFWILSSFWKMIRIVLPNFPLNPSSILASEISNAPGSNAYQKMTSSGLCCSY